MTRMKTHSNHAARYRIQAITAGPNPLDVRNEIAGDIASQRGARGRHNPVGEWIVDETREIERFQLGRICCLARSVA